ncbi:MAG: polymer-forming cytoskeletal protein [Bacteroidota bacterium]
MFNRTKKEMKQAANGPDASNIIGKSTTLEGNLNTAGNLRIEGKVIGGIRSTAKVVLSSSSTLEGSIVAQQVEIAGKVQGTIEVMELLILKPTAVIEGDITAIKLVFEEGAKFNGKCHMGDRAGKVPAKESMSHTRLEGVLNAKMPSASAAQK